MNLIARQGDVLLFRVSELPKGAKDVTPKNGDVILAYGEVTGHAHRIKRVEHPSARIYDFGAERYIESLGRYEAGAVPGKIVDRDKTSITVLHPIHGRTKFLITEVKEHGAFVEALHPWSPLEHEEHSAEALSEGYFRQAYQHEEKRAEITRVAD